MRDNQRIATPSQIASDGIGQRAVCEEFYNDRGIKNDHRESRNSRNTCAGLLFVAKGLACCARSSHSCKLGRSAVRSSSRFTKSERLMPSRAARALRML